MRLGQIQYFNVFGEPYTSEANSFWLNEADQLWYRGDKQGVIVVEGAYPPWDRPSGYVYTPGDVVPPGPAPGPAGSTMKTLVFLGLGFLAYRKFVKR